MSSITNSEKTFPLEDYDVVIDDKEALSLCEDLKLIPGQALPDT